MTRRRVRLALSMALSIACFIAIIAIGCPARFGSWRGVHAAAAFYLVVVAVLSEVRGAQLKALADHALHLARRATDARIASARSVLRALQQLSAATARGATWTNIRIHIDDDQRNAKFVMCTSATGEPDAEACELCARGRLSAGLAWPRRRQP